MHLKLSSFPPLYSTFLRSAATKLFVQLLVPAETVASALRLMWCLRQRSRSSGLPQGYMHAVCVALCLGQYEQTQRMEQNTEWYPRALCAGRFSSHGSLMQQQQQWCIHSNLSSLLDGSFVYNRCPKTVPVGPYSTLHLPGLLRTFRDLGQRFLLAHTEDVVGAVCEVVADLVKSVRG